MARLEYAILCKDVEEDEAGGINFLRVFNSFEIETPDDSNSDDEHDGDDEELGKFVTSWIQTDFEKPEVVEARLRLVDPDNKKLLPDFPMKIGLNSIRVVAITSIPASTQFRKAGLHFLKIHMLSGKSKRWKLVADMPLTVVDADE